VVKGAVLPVMFKHVLQPVEMQGIHAVVKMQQFWVKELLAA